MTEVYREIIRSVSTSLGKLRTDVPGVMQGFNALAEAAMGDSALSKKTKRSSRLR